jgi:serine protease Do
VTPDSPAQKGGVQAGDVIMKFNGKDVSTMRGLPRFVAQTPIGKAVELEVLRKGQRLKLNVTVGRLSEDEDKDKATGDGNAPGAPGPVGGQTDLLGLKLAPMSEELRKKFSLGARAQGVVVVEVDEKSAAAKRNIRAGDLIVEAAQEAVKTPDDLARSIEKMRKAGRKQVLLRIEDAKGDMRFVAVPID